MAGQLPDFNLMKVPDFGPHSWIWGVASFLDHHNKASVATGSRGGL